MSLLLFFSLLLVVFVCLSVSRETRARLTNVLYKIDPCVLIAHSQRASAIRAHKGLGTRFHLSHFSRDIRVLTRS